VVSVDIEDIEQVPDAPAVFVIWPRGEAGAQPYLGRTGLLRRRLSRLLKKRDTPSKILNLREVAGRVEYALTGSQLESTLLFYRLARAHFPDSYLKLIKLRMPAYVKLILSNEFPRVSVTSRVTGGASLYYGPFRTRSQAELFTGQFLDLFQIRRCEENLAPNPAHPGCIYGEMNMCLRPCQEVVTASQYATEVERVSQFLKTDGLTLIDKTSATRDRLSEDMDFEEAAKMHRKIERIRQILTLRDDLVCDIDRLHGVAVAQSAEVGILNLFVIRRGWWHGPLALELNAGSSSLDRRLRDMVYSVPDTSAGKGTASERQEHLALLAKWFYSSWRDGEFLQADSFEELSYRKLVNAVARVAKGVAVTAAAPSERT
jgi:excinuclease UvrABC nuclease subunit